jgi:hypothetical protein
MVGDSETAGWESPDLCGLFDDFREISNIL